MARMPRVRSVAMALAWSISLAGAPAAGEESKLVYGITPDGRLEWSLHAGWRDGAPLSEPVAVSSGWGEFTKVFAGCGGIFYAIRPSGELLWFKHLGAAQGKVEWEGPKTVGSGWAAFREVFADCTGAVYAMTQDGELQWRRHVGFATGTMEWEGPTVVGSGWTTFDKVFSGCRGTIYGIKPSGELLWYDHVDPAHGAPDWRGPNVVGSGWTIFSKVFSGCDGIIYGQKPSGELVWYNHTGHADGESEWMEPRQIRAGASYVAAFAVPLVASDRPPEQGCPEMDALSLPANVGYFRFHGYPPEQTSVYSATWIGDNEKLLPGKAGVDRIVDVIMRSLTPGCAPIGQVYVLAGADFDSRGRAFEDSVSVERAWKAGHEIKAALEAVRLPAVARGDVVDKRVYFATGGMGTRSPAHANPSSEEQRKANRWLTVNLVQEHQSDVKTTPVEALPYRQ